MIKNPTINNEILIKIILNNPKFFFETFEMVIFKKIDAFKKNFLSYLKLLNYFYDLIIKNMFVFILILFISYNNYINIYFMIT